MQKGHHLTLKCPACENTLDFSLFGLEEKSYKLSCLSCHNIFHFEDEMLQKQLKQFESLCVQIVESEDILSQTAVGIDIGEHHVKIPFKLLLTRLTSVLELNMGGEKVEIAFRMEPLKDLRKNHG